jgi:hypothetical protein
MMMDSPKIVEVGFEQSAQKQEFVRKLVIQLIKERKFSASWQEFRFLYLTPSPIFSNQPADSQTTDAARDWLRTVRTFLTGRVSKVVC